ncbi:MAG: 6-carboxytetrahydropterin synthase QueD [Treponemataceae bacterium]|nr:MAG: 6-carboxytetrahydropterin synthase QueD [Treponemataceae bacterium]
MFEVRVEALFSAAHFLRDYHGKCENLHGHNYTVFAHIRGGALGEGGMLVDFAVIKKHLRAVCDSLDHTNLNEMPEFKQNPSAERIAQFIFEKLEPLAAASNAALYAIDVFETPASRARYTKG